MRLFIAEKPSLGKAIAAALKGSRKFDRAWIQVGDDVVTWAFGHLFEQAQPDDYEERYKRWNFDDLPIIPSEWRMKPRQDALPQVGVIESLLRSASEVIHAGDADREGQLIIDEVLTHLGYLGPVRRLWLHELNEAGVRKAMAKMRANDEYRGYRNSAVARSRADWLLGMNATRGYTALWRRAGGDGVFHIGRVQTPTLGLVVARDREIASFVPVEYFNVLARFAHGADAFTAKWFPNSGRVDPDAEGRLLRKEIAQARAKSLLERKGPGNALVEDMKVERKRELPPLPYSLADLQKEANARLGLSPQQVLDVAQTLYETHKLTSYPRTDCPYLPESEHANACGVIEALRCNFGSEFSGHFPGTPDLNIKGPAWNDKHVGAHYAIIPTAQSKPLDQLNSAEHGVYTMIARRYLALFHPAYEFDTTVVSARVGDEVFRAYGNTPAVIGWRILAPIEKPPGGEWSYENQSFPTMLAGDPLTLLDVMVDAKKTKAPPHFNGGTLIEAMQKAYLFVEDPAVKARLKESQGIGTEATRAGIIKALVDRGYLEERAKGRSKSKDLVHTERGALLFDMVDADLRRVDLTAWFEGLLDDVLMGALPLAAFELTQEAFVEDMVKRMAVPANLAPKPVAGGQAMICPKCGKEMVPREGKQGRFLGCRGYPVCRHTEEIRKEAKA